MGKIIVDVLYTLALFANAILFLPQAYRLYQKKHARDVSLVTFFGFNIIQVLSILNGVYYKDHALIYGSIPGFFTCGLVVLLIVFYRTKAKAAYHRTK